MYGTAGQKKEEGPMGPDWAELLASWKKGKHPAPSSPLLCAWISVSTDIGIKTCRIQMLGKKTCYIMMHLE